MSGTSAYGIDPGGSGGLFTRIPPPLSFPKLHRWYGPAGVGIGFVNFQPSTTWHHAFVAPGSVLGSSVWEMKPGRIFRAVTVAGLRDVGRFFVAFLVAMGILHEGEPGNAGVPLNVSPRPRRQMARDTARPVRETASLMPCTPIPSTPDHDKEIRQRPTGIVLLESLASSPVTC